MKATNILYLLLILAGSSLQAQGIWAVQSSNTGHDLNAIHFVDSSYGWAVGADVVVVHTQDGGQNWVVQDLGITTGTFYGVHFISREVGWIVGTATRLYRTSDGGTTWIPVSISGIGGAVFDVFFIDANRGWLIAQPGMSSPGGFFRTSDGGQSWTSQPIATANLLRNIYFTDSLNGWTTGYMSSILHTTDGGRNWTNQSVSVNGIQFEDIYFVNPDTGWVVGDNYVFTTTDGGANWTQQFPTNTATLQAVAAPRYDRLWAAGKGGAIRFSDDGGLSWVSQPSGTGDRLHSLSFPTARQGWAAGEGGRIVHYRDTTPNTTGLFPEIAYPGQVLSIAPHPWQQVSEVSWQEAISQGPFQLELINLEGRVLRKWTCNSHRIELQRAGLPAGLYVLQVKNKSRTIGRAKMLVTD
jgi:photosystem II stability/assembly factor-like uncharacterized protein